MRGQIAIAELGQAQLGGRRRAQVGGRRRRDFRRQLLAVELDVFDDAHVGRQGGQALL